MIAIIPARGGSKGVPGKNIKELGGKPLIAHTIAAALGAACIDDVVVTTDSPSIADVAAQAGARVPFLRPDSLATDTSSAVDVYIHAVEFLSRELGKPIEKFMVLLPTAPFRDSEDIDRAYDLFCREKACTLLAVKEADVPPSWYVSGTESHIEPCGFGGDNILNNRQLSARYYIPCGAIYILDYQLLKEKRTYFSDRTAAYVMKPAKAVDIDTMDDFRYAEYLMQKD